MANENLEFGADRLAGFGQDGNGRQRKNQKSPNEKGSSTRVQPIKLPDVSTSAERTEAIKVAMLSSQKALYESIRWQLGNIKIPRVVEETEVPLPPEELSRDKRLEDILSVIDNFFVDYQSTSDQRKIEQYKKFFLFHKTQRLRLVGEAGSQSPWIENNNVADAKRRKILNLFNRYGLGYELKVRFVESNPRNLEIDTSITQLVSIDDTVLVGREWCDKVSNPDMEVAVAHEAQHHIPDRFDVYRMALIDTDGFFRDSVGNNISLTIDDKKRLKELIEMRRDQSALLALVQIGRYQIDVAQTMLVEFLKRGIDTDNRIKAIMKFVQR